MYITKIILNDILHCIICTRPSIYEWIPRDLKAVPKRGQNNDFCTLRISVQAAVLCDGFPVSAMSHSLKTNMNPLLNPDKRRGPGDYWP